jgi:HD superfamily phosphohydrolase
MARPNKSGVDYFPHDTTASNGKTIFTLESKFGNDGYAFWFKLLEVLGSQDCFYLDCNNVSEWIYLTAKTRVDETTATEILNTLANIDAIDKDLWSEKIIWCQKFVNRLSDVFKKRLADTPQKPSFRSKDRGKEEFSERKLKKTRVSGAESTQRKVKKRREEKRKEEKSRAQDVENDSVSSELDHVVDLYNLICSSLPKVITLTEKRREKLKARFLELESLNKFEELFYKTEKSDFLTGRGDSKWRCSFDWLMANDTNYCKVLEGHYDNRKRAAKSGNPFLDMLLTMEDEESDEKRDCITDGSDQDCLS